MLNEDDIADLLTGQGVVDGADVEDTGFGDVDGIDVYVAEDAFLSVDLLKLGD